MGERGQPGRLGEEELRRRLAEALSSEAMLGAYSADYVDENQVRRLLDEATLRGIVGVRYLASRMGGLVVVFFREEVCERSCDQRCGGRANECFGKCFHECREAYRGIVREKLLGGEG